MTNNKKLTKCDFCRFWTGSGCRVTPNSRYCKEASDEYFNYIRGNKAPVQKSLRPWERR